MSSTALNDKYMQICGTICSGISSDYPMLIWMGPSMRPFLVPCSVLCGVSLYNITSKSLRTKMCTTHCLFFKNGTKVTAIVRKDRKESNDYTVKAIIVGANKNNHEETQYGCFVVDCAVSDKPRQCYTEKFGEVVVPPMLAGPNPIANIPYRALVDIKIMDNSEDGSRVIDPTKRIFLRPVLVKILSVCPYHPSDVTKRENFFSFLRLCPWNKDRVKQNEELDSIYINKNLPKLEERVSMCFLGGDRAFCIEDPAKQAKITLGIDYSKGSERSPVSIMEEGQMFYGDILYNPYIGGYHLQDYRYHNDLPALTRRTVFDTGLHVNESQFELWICESSLFRGFYTCSGTLSVNLIADPKRILRNVDLLWHHERGGAPVWIRVEPGGDCHRLAPFSVAALDLESEQFLAREKMAHQPNIVGVGILVDLGTGAVFSHDHPQTAIRLSEPDMEQERIPFGRFFHFSAAYWPRGDFFLVGPHHLIEKKEPLRTFYLYNEHKLAFEDDFICGTIQKDQVHLSWEFGPVEDVHDLVGEKVRKSRAPGIYGCPYDDDPNDPSYYDEKKAKVKEEPPSLLYLEDSGNVCFNPDWKPGVSGDSQIMLHSLGELDSDAQEITNLTKKPTEEWWRKDLVDKEGYCRCSQLWYLLKNVQMAWKEDQQQEQQEEEEMNLDVDI